MVTNLIMNERYILNNTYLILKNRNVYLISTINKDKLEIRLPPIVAIILNYCDGTNYVCSIVRYVSILMCSSISQSELFVMKVIEQFSDFIRVADNNEVITNLGLKDIIKNTDGYKIEPLKNTRLIAPTKEIVFMASQNCEFRCIYCYAANNNRGYDKVCYLSKRRWEEIMREGRDNGCHSVFFSGGDPFLNPNIIDYIKTSYSEGYDCKISTRRMIDFDLAAKLYDSGLRFIQVSLDSYIPQIVDQMTGVRNSFDMALCTIRNAQKTNIQVKCKCVATSINYCDIPQLIDFLYVKGVDEISINHYMMSDGRNHKSLLLNDKQIEWLDKKILEKQRENKIKIDYEFGKAVYAIVSRKTLNMLRKRCGACKDTIIINYDGMVYYCEYLIDDSRFVVGDINKEGLMEIWNSDLVNSLIEPQRDRFINTDCHSCSEFEQCYPRRCFLRTKIEYGTPFEKDPWCPFSDTNKFY